MGLVTFLATLWGRWAIFHNLLQLLKSQTGWTDWANFRQLGDCLLWAVLFKITEIFWLLFPQYKKVCTYLLFLTRNGSGYTLGIFFTNSTSHPSSKFITYIPMYIRFGDKRLRWRQCDQKCFGKVLKSFTVNKK
jgi:hypothetical protein